MQLDAFASIVLYLAVFITAAVFAYLGQKTNRKTFVILAILLPALLAAFRYSAGTDSLTYRELYNEIGGESAEIHAWRVTDGGLEPFVVYVSAIGNYLQLPPSFLFFAFAIITTGFLYLTTRTFSRNRAWLFYGMLMLIVFPESFNMMRQLAANSVQAFALARILKAQRYNVRVRIVPIILLLAASVMLHYSSVLIMPVFLLPIIIKYVRGRTLALLLCLFICGCVLAFPTLLNFVINLGILTTRHYETFMEMPGSIINIKFFTAAILAAIMLANYRRRELKFDKQYSLLLLLGAAYAAVGFYSGYLGRLAVFFWIFIVMIGGEMLCQLFKKDRHRFAICSAAAILYFLVFFCVLGFEAIIPYSIAL